MALEYASSNGSRAMRLARKLVKPLDWGDIESVIYGSLTESELNELLMAIDSDFLKQQEQLSRLTEALANALPDIQLLHNWSDMYGRQETVRLIAWFQLGFATALRLLDRQPEMAVIDGGNREPKLHGSSSL